MYAKIKLRQIGQNCVRKWKRKVLSLLLFLWLWNNRRVEKFTSQDQLHHDLVKIPLLPYEELVELVIEKFKIKDGLCVIVHQLT